VNQDILEQIRKQDYAAIQSTITEFLCRQIEKANSSGLVFGLSGGIDSAVIAHICAKSFGEKTLALIMPDSRVSPKEETEDALDIVDSLKMQYKLIDISLIHTQFANIVEPDERALGNLRARIRASILYYYANLKNYLVIGSSDKSEQMIGYFTKFGDGSADILPIASLYKTQIRELARHLGVKDSIITKKSSPHLWHGHIAEEEIGISYEEVDAVLYCTIDKAMPIDEVAKATAIDRAKIEKIYQLYKKSEHKRIMPSRL
jgi:NAD+ synthase